MTVTYCPKCTHQHHPEYLGCDGLRAAPSSVDGGERLRQGVTTFGPRALDTPEKDLVNHPPHYTEHPSGIECIQVTEHMGFCLGNAVKYIWRADLKGNAIEDLKKARWYIDREIAKREGAAAAAAGGQAPSA